ncbi:MAG TPA: HD domain-containing protein [Actinomycetota bacterium]|nr:HD domain-containing protein [Actinomycetota bacterium]
MGGGCAQAVRGKFLSRAGRHTGALTDYADALDLVRSKAEKDITVRHLITVGGVMRRLARHFGEDEDRWALVGLFHDIDMDQTHDDLERHAYVGAGWLREAGIDEQIVNAVLAHAHEQYRTDLVSRAIVPADAVTGFLVACALVRPEKVAGMKVSSCRKKLKERSFAPGVNRDEIRGCEESIGVPLDELLQLGIEGLELVAAEVGLTA